MATSSSRTAIVDHAACRASADVGATRGILATASGRSGAQVFVRQILGFLPILPDRLIKHPRKESAGAGNKGSKGKGAQTKKSEGAVLRQYKTAQALLKGAKRIVERGRYTDVKGSSSWMSCWSILVLIPMGLMS